MASWKENKIVGIVAGMIFVLSIVLLVRGILIKGKPTTNTNINIPTEEEQDKVMRRIMK